MTSPPKTLDNTHDASDRSGLSRRQLVVRGAGALGALAALNAGGALQKPAAAARRSGSLAAKKGGTLVIGADSVGVDFVPPHIFQGRGHAIARQAMLEGLYEYPNGDISKPYAAVLASGPPKASPDGLSYTVPLRTGVKFHDGTPFNADAVEFNYMRYLDKSHPYYDPQATYVPATLLTGVSKVQAVGAYSVKFTLIGPLADFIAAIVPYGQILSPTAVQQAGVANAGLNPVGTGPFQFVSARKGDQVEVAGWGGYRGGAPSLSRLIVRAIPDSRTLTASLLSGEVHLSTFVPRGDIGLFREISKFQVAIVPSAVTGYMGINAGGSGGFTNLKDVRARQAVVHAVDKQKIIKLALQGYGEVGAGINPPASWGYQKAFLDFNKYDPTLAKNLLSQSGANPEILLLTQASGYWPQMAEIMQADLNAVGFKTEVRQLDSAVYYGTITQGKQDICIGEGSTDVFLPHSLYRTFFGCNNVRRGRWGGWCDPAFDRAITQLTLDDNRERSLKRIRYIDRALLQPGIFQTNYYPSLVTVYDKRLEGIHPLPVHEMAGFGSVSYK